MDDNRNTDDGPTDRGDSRDRLTADSESDGPGDSAGARSGRTRVRAIDPHDVLVGVESLEVHEWEYEARRGITHLGPMPGEFNEEFGLGVDATRISGVDADGVALAAIQGLAARLEDTRREVARRDERIDEQAERITELERRNEDLAERVTALERRLRMVEEAWRD